MPLRAVRSAVGRRLCSLFIALQSAGGVCSAQVHNSNLELAADPRGAPELTICTQNLENYGKYSDSAAKMPGLSPDEFKEKERALVSRFVRARCDIIAVQELLGKSDAAAEEALKQIAAQLRQRTNRIFEVRVGPTNDKVLHNGFLIASDRASVENIVSYVRTELPRISEKQKPRKFSRGPLEIQTRVRGIGGSPDRLISFVTFHFKSKSGAKGDPAGLEFETYRLEMAEALRRIVENRHSQSFASGDTLLVLLGDRNSNFDVASARVLEGVLTLKHFQKDGPCRLSKRGVPLCKAGSIVNQRLFSVLTGDPQTRAAAGTYSYKNVYSWLDDILLPAESLRTTWVKYDTVGDYDSGVVYKPEAAADHALAWVRMNW